MGVNDLPRLDKGLAISSALLLAGYFAFALYAMSSPSNDPQRGMAQGFITFVALVLLLFAGALWFGVARNHRWVVRIVFAVSVFPALSLIAQETFLMAHRAP
jgi:hypothetical protein